MLGIVLGGEAVFSMVILEENSSLEGSVSQMSILFRGLKLFAQSVKTCAFETWDTEIDGSAWSR